MIKNYLWSEWKWDYVWPLQWPLILSLDIVDYFTLHQSRSPKQGLPCCCKLCNTMAACPWLWEAPRWHPFSLQTWQRLLWLILGAGLSQSSPRRPIHGFLDTESRTTGLLLWRPQDWLFPGIFHMCSHWGPSMAASDQTYWPRKPHSALMSGFPCRIISLTCNQTYHRCTNDYFCSKKFNPVGRWDYILSMLNHKFYKNKILSSSCPRGACPGKRSTEGWIHASIKRNTLHVQ